ncbi:hypothetical protein MHB77_14960 [Paenibacillus sp. FSL K6-3166]
MDLELAVTDSTVNRITSMGEFFGKPRNGLESGVSAVMNFGLLLLPVLS